MGRPRKISEDEALERALQLFWRNGYDRTSVADLGQAIGVGPSSLYNAFGSKDEIFERALCRYMEYHAHVIEEALEVGEDEDAVTVIQRVLYAAVHLYTSPKAPRGCALLQSGGAGFAQDSQASAITLAIKGELEKRIRKALQAAAENSSTLPAPPNILSKYVLATMRGLSQLAVDGVSRKELMQIAQLAAGSCVSRSL